jgi:uncharacterized protein (TIGR03437 family)
VPVTITVAGSSPAVLSVSPLMESFSLAQGGSAVSSQVTVSNAGSGTLNFTAQASSTPAWLMLANSSGSATSSTPAALGFTIDPTGLSPGLYTGQITVSDTASANQSTVTVVLTVTQAAESIQLSQTGLAFSGVTGGAQPPGQAFTVANSGAGTLNWSAQASTLSGGSWLLLSAGGGTSASGQAGIPVVVSVDPTGLSPGQYYGSVNVTATGATNSPQTVSVVLTVSPAQTSPGETISTGGVILAGAAGGTTPLQQIVNVFNPSSAAVTYTSTTSMANGTGWLSVTPPSGSVSPGTNGIPVVVNLSGLAAGLYSGSVSLAFGDGSSATIQVLALATGGATGSAVTGKAGNKPRPLALTPCAGGKPGFLIPILQQPVNQSTVAVAAPQTVEVEIIDSCGNPVTTAAGGTVQVTFSGAGSKNDPGLSLQDIGGGIWEATWAPVNPANQVTLQVEASEAGITLNPTLNVGNSVTVTVQGATTTTAPQPTGVANAASAALATPGVVAPGSYVAIYGTGLAGSGNPSATSLPLPTTLNGTQLLLGGIPMPLLYAGPTQVNAIVPQAIAPNATYPLVVVTGGTVQSVPMALTVTELQPGVYTADFSGSGAGIVTNALTYQVINASNPAHVNDYLTIYGTGLGAVSGSNGQAAPADGAATPVTDSDGNSLVFQNTATVTATVGGVSAQVLFSGLTATLAALYQVDVQVPQGVTPGSAVPVVITETDTTTGATASSNPVTIVVQ